MPLNLKITLKHDLKKYLEKKRNKYFSLTHYGNAARKAIEAYANKQELLDKFISITVNKILAKIKIASADSELVEKIIGEMHNQTSHNIKKALEELKKPELQLSKEEVVKKQKDIIENHVNYILLDMLRSNYLDELTQHVNKALAEKKK